MSSFPFWSSIFGQLCLSILLGFALVIAQHPYWYLFIFIFLFFSFSTKPNLTLVAGLSFLSVFFRTLEWLPTYLRSLLGLEHTNTSMALSWVTSGLIIITLYCSSALFLFWISSKKNKNVNPTLTILVTLILILSALHFFQNNRIVSGLIGILAILYSKISWRFVQIIDEIQLKGRKYLLEKIASLHPFWIIGFVERAPIPLSLNTLIDNQFTNKEEKIQMQLNGLKLISTSTFLLFFGMILDFIFFNHGKLAELFQKWPEFSLNLAAPQIIGYAEYNQLNISPLERWISCSVINPLVFYLTTNLGYMGIMCGGIWMMGFQIPRPYNKPYLAQSMGDLFRRLYFYYNEIIIRFFLIPFLHFFARFTSQRRLRIFLSVFFAVTLGGWVLHVQVMLVDNFLKQDVPFGLKSSLNFFLYHSTLGLASALSAIQKERIGRPTYYSFWKAVFILLIHGFCFSLHGNVSKESISDQLFHIKSLFSIAGI